MSFRIGRALGFAILIWVTGFIWGSIVFMMPSLNSVASMPYVSRNPATSFPLLILWPVLIYLLARNFFQGATNKPAQGIKLGLVFWIVNFCLDLVVLVFLLKTGFDYFASLTVWIAYGLLLILPWLVGRSLEKAE